MICLNVLLLFCCVLLVKTDQRNDLITVVQIMRHGQRTPMFFNGGKGFKNMSEWDGLEPGQLVNEGKMQQYELGIKTRQRYGGLLPEIYKSSDIYVTTSNLERTYMSAGANLAGLYPPKGNQIWNKRLLWQPVPIHIEETYCISQMECATIREIQANVVKNDPLFVNITQKYEWLFDYLNRHYESNVSNIFDAWDVWDVLFLKNLTGKELPSWALDVYPEPLQTIAGYAVLSFSHTEKLKKLNTGVFLSELLEHFDKMLVNSSSSHTFKMYSAHDLNIAAILNTFGSFEPHVPFFANSLYFELRRGNGTAIVNVWYKNKTKFSRVVVKGCEFHCPYTQFKSFLKLYTLSPEEFTKLCRIPVKRNIRTDERDAALINSIKRIHSYYEPDEHE